jgi:lipopolysaccharide/colanic/teichoic acid biosynthesis glycosyltransferase
MGLVILSPFFILIALVIKITSKGPVFFLQDRVGLNGKIFKIVKFRTMFVNSESKGSLTVGGKDPRVTEFGYFLRKFKLDELPQLINVLSGEMSFVGPRPEVPKYVKLYTPEQRIVLNVKPGITDNASIKFRNENELLSNASDPEEFYITQIMPEKIVINLDYIKRRTFFSDLGVMWRTFLSIFH